MYKQQEYILEHIGYHIAINERYDILENVFLSIIDDSVLYELNTQINEYIFEFKDVLFEGKFTDFLKTFKQEWKAGVWDPQINLKTRTAMKVQAIKNTANAQNTTRENYWDEVMNQKDPAGFITKFANTFGLKKVGKLIGKGALKAMGEKGRNKFANYLRKKAAKHLAAAVKQRGRALEDYENKEYNTMKRNEQKEIGRGKESVRQGIQNAREMVLPFLMKKKNPKDELNKGWYKTARKGHNLIKLAQKIQGRSNQGHNSATLDWSNKRFEH